MVYTETYKAYNSSLLQSEIATAVAPAIVTSIGNDGVSIFIETAEELNSAQQIALATAVAGHDSEPLSNLKSRLIAQASAHYKSLRDAGFVHAGKSFAGNVNAIASSNSGKHKASQQAYPISVPANDGTKYEIVDVADFDAIFDGIEAHARACLEGYAVACDNITTAVDKTSAQTAYDNYVA